MGERIRRLLSTVNTFYHFTILLALRFSKLKVPVQTGGSVSWRAAETGTALEIHMTQEQRHFRCFGVTSGAHRCIYSKIPVCRLLHRSKTCSLITIINKH